MSLPRRTELRRKAPPPRSTTPLARSELRRTAVRPRTASSRSGKATPARDVPTALRRRVLERDLQCCVRCGRHTSGIRRSLQHRQARGQGGRIGAHTAANLILLCGDGLTGCHGWVEDRRNWTTATELGWAVSAFAPDPAAVPVLVQWLGWCWPGEEWIPYDPEVA